RAEEVVLDLNRLAEGHSFMALGAFEVDDAGRWLAYSTDRVGFRVYDLRIRDLGSGEDLPDSAADVGSIAWAADGRTLFYTAKDAAKREYRVFRHTIGAPRDVLVYEEPDERFSLRVWRSRSGALLFMACESLTTREVRFLPADVPHGAWTALAPRRQDREVHADHHGSSLFVLTNDQGRNFRLVEAPLNDLTRWNEIVPHRPDVMLEEVDCFQDHVVIQEREDGLLRLRVITLADRSSHRVEFPEPVYSAALSTNREFATSAVRYAYQSFTTPPSTYDYDMERRTPTLLKRQEVLGGYDPARYESRRLHATAADGTLIPISLVCERGVARPAPLLLYTYGAYGLPLSATFSSHRFSLLDRGVVFAIAHVRGGGE